MASPKKFSSAREKLHEIIFEADTPAGKIFDVVLLVAILLSILVLMLDTVPKVKEVYGTQLYVIEWIITGLFTVEYILRIYSVYKPLKYVFSFYGLVDLLSILPTFLSLVVTGSQYLATIRALRLLRVARILKLTRFSSESQVLMKALKASRVKITVFMGAILTVVVIIGSIMYYIEGTVNENFDSIPRAMYWAIVTMTTVGYGDITPVTTLGQFFSAMLMVLGYGILAVPTGIVSVEMAQASRSATFINTRACRSCGREGHADDAVFCKFCGEKL